MPRYRLTLAYDGTAFCGWQKQRPPAHALPAHAHLPRLDAEPAPPDPADGGDRLTLRTVQEVVERATRTVVRQPVQLIGASRTDSGVHARGQVAAFTTLDDPGNPGSGWPESRGAERLRAALNARLPDDVVAVACDVAPPAFDPIADAAAKAYSYAFDSAPTRPVFDRAFVHHVRDPLDEARMAEAAWALVGEHDFAAFAAAGHGRLTTVRTIFSCTARRTGEHRVQLEVAGSGFLLNMVRIIAGTLMEVGHGRRAPDDVARALASRERARAGPTLPPSGLCLEWIRYEAGAGANTPAPAPPGGQAG